MARILEIERNKLTIKEATERGDHETVERCQMEIYRLWHEMADVADMHGECLLADRRRNMARQAAQHAARARSFAICA